MILPTPAFRKLLEIIRDNDQFDAPSREWYKARLGLLDAQENAKSDAVFRGLFDKAAGDALRSCETGSPCCN